MPRSFFFLSASLPASLNFYLPSRPRPTTSLASRSRPPLAHLYVSTLSKTLPARKQVLSPPSTDMPSSDAATQFLTAAAAAAVSSSWASLVALPRKLFCFLSSTERARRYQRALVSRGKGAIRQQTATSRMRAFAKKRKRLSQKPGHRAWEAKEMSMEHFFPFLSRLFSLLLFLPFVSLLARPLCFSPRNFFSSALSPSPFSPPLALPRRYFARGNSMSNET